MSVIGKWLDKLLSLFSRTPGSNDRRTAGHRPGAAALNRGNRPPDSSNWGRKRLENALASLEGGDMSALSAVYANLILSEPDDVRRCAASLRRAVEPWLAASLEGLRTCFHQHAHLLWSGEWRNLSPADFEAHITDRDDLFAVLVLGAFHPCGYFREKCLIRLEGFGGRSLPLTIPHVNNWVEPVRQKALAISRRLINSASLPEVLANLGCLEKVRRGERRGEADLRALLQSAAEKIAAERAHLSPETVLRLDNPARRLAFQIIISGQLLSADDELRLLRGETEPAGRRRLAKLLLARETVSDEVLDYLRQSRSPGLRLAWLKHWSQRPDRSPADLENFLYDANGGIREYARFLLRKNGSADFAEKYRRALQVKPSAGALAGLGECGGPEDAALAEPFLRSGRPALVRAALTALAGLRGADCAETLLNFLTDPAGSGRACFLALKLKLVLPSAQLYELFFTTNQPAVQVRLARLISQQSRWDQLPYLIKLLQATDGPLREWLEGRLRDWVPAYTKPYPSQLALITQNLAEETIPPDLRKNLELTLTALELI